MSTSPAHRVFQEWAKAHDITPSLLAEQTGWSYQHAWNILDGRREISLQTLGLLLVTYGKQGPALAIAEAIRQARKISVQNGK